jgi:hypothetical protein
VRRPLALSPLLLAACSAASPSTMTVDITAGQETTAFTDAPAIAAVEVTVTSVDGTVNVQRSAMPGQGLDFGDIPGAEAITIAVTGYDASQAVQMNGSSLSGIVLDTIEGGTLPVFVERTNGWSRPPGGFAAGHVGGTTAVVAERFLMLTGGSRPSAATTGDPTGVDAYDVFALGGDSTTAAWSVVPETIVSLDPTSTQPDPQLVLLSSAGASVLDYATGVSTTPNLPVDLSSFADVAGGRVVPATGGATGSRFFVVGAARRAGLSGAVLEVDSDGTLVGWVLNTVRQGAATAWIADVGLVVVGGSPSGSGVEVLGTTATGFASTMFPADSTQGAGAISDGLGGVVLVGGLAADGSPAPTRHISFTTCVTAATCMPTFYPPAATLPVALQNVTGYALTLAATTNPPYLVVGDDLTGTGLTLSYIVDVGTEGTPSATPAPFREPRKGAIPTAVPNGTLAVLGGEHADGSPALSVELFYP